MKSILKSISFFLLFTFLGFALIIGCIALFTDTTIYEMMEKILNAGIFKILLSCIISITTLFLAGFLQIIIHEGGHLIMGLIYKFKFVSFRVFQLTLIKYQGKYKLKNFHIQGTGGQCLLSPPDAGLEKTAIMWYLAGGFLLNLLTAGICFTIWFSFDNLSMFLNMFLMYMSITGLLLALMNGIPLKASGISNDGYNMVLIHKDSTWINSFAAQLFINAALQEGTRIKDMPEAWFNNPVITNYKNIFQVSEKQIYATRLLDQGNYDEAHAVLNELNQHEKEMIGLLAKEIACELLFLELYHYQNMQRADELYTDDLKKYIIDNSKTMSSKQRILCILAHYKDNAYDQSKAIYENTLSKKQDYLMQGEVATDLEIMEKALCLVER